MRPSSLKKNEIQSSLIPTLKMEEYLAKTRPTENGLEKGCTVAAHLVATWRVGKILLDYFRFFRSGELWDDHDLIAPLTHDIGKISPPFQDKIYNACGESRNLVSTAAQNEENHCITSSVVLSHLKLKNLAWVAASHHGAYCHAMYSLKDEWLGGSSWNTQRENLLHDLCNRFSLKLEDVSSEEWKRTLILGLTILADWLSSGLDLEYGEEPTEEMCAEAVRKAGFQPFFFRKGLTFGDVFQNRDGSSWEPNPLQRKMAENIKPGAVYILEMEMGSGKTEASLYLAYKLLSEFQHNGFYFALPTCLTSDKIYDRVTPFLKKILSSETPERKALLLHGKAWLRKFLPQTDSEGFQKIDSDREDWFDSKKRGLLAPFAVGTIDQLLMSVIHVRHNALRALGAAGKVIILDEVHSYDAYTGTLIKRLIEFLRQWGCTVIILSATLTRKVREELLGISTEPDSCEAYPLLSIYDGEKVSYHTVPSLEAEKIVRLCHSNDLEQSLQSALEHANRGECVLWIENTVAIAQHVFQQLSLRKPQNVRIGLIHSRFQEYSRRKNEKEWVDLYGKDAPPEERAGGKILVGTQVLEQSVDIDADFLITRLCPTDMFLQRIGRLWRHRKLNATRPPSAECCAEILQETAVFSEKPQPYSGYVLARSLEVLQNWEVLSIPRDMRTLIEATYAEREETGNNAILKKALQERITKLERFAEIASGNVQNVEPDTEASTRFSEEETVDVLLLEDYNAAERLLKPFGSSRWILIPDRNAEKKKRNQCAAVLSYFLVRVGKSKAPVYNDFPLDFLSHILYTGRDQNRPLRGAFVGSGGALLNLSQHPANSEDGNHSLRYTQGLGYCTEKKEG